MDLFIEQYKRKGDHFDGYLFKSKLRRKYQRRQMGTRMLSSEHSKGFFGLTHGNNSVLKHGRKFMFSH